MPIKLKEKQYLQDSYLSSDLKIGRPTYISFSNILKLFHGERITEPESPIFGQFFRFSVISADILKLIFVYKILRFITRKVKSNLK